jgi:hypothetical protein
MFAHAHHSVTQALNVWRLAVVVLGALLATPLVAQQSPRPNDTEGHCRFNLQNQWAGPYRACIDPSTPAQCEDTGKRDQNSGATFAPGSCPALGRVGTCAKSDASVHYYDGDPASIEVGCGFQGGTWKTGS